MDWAEGMPIQGATKNRQSNNTAIDRTAEISKGRGNNPSLLIEFFVELSEWFYRIFQRLLGFGITIEQESL